MKGWGQEKLINVLFFMFYFDLFYISDMDKVLWMFMEGEINFDFFLWEQS